MITKATVEDLKNVDLHCMGMNFYTESLLPGKYIPAIFIKNWTKFFELKCGVIFLLWCETKLIGAIGGLIHPDPYDDIVVAQEMFWFVTQDKRGKVGAVRLYYEFEQWAKENNARRLSMACVCNKSIASVRKFYEANGFKPKDVSYFKAL